MEKVTWYRAVCFEKPVGPWRRCRNKMRHDLIENGLGSYDEWGSFFVTVPGDIQIRWEWDQSKAA